MKRLLALVVCCVITGAALLLPILIYRLAPNSWIYSEQYRKAGDVISKIERYKKEHNVYPPNLSELGIEEKEEGPFYYRLQDDGTFWIWFSGGKSFFACQTYDSGTREWCESD